jgi:hypothetical protein
MFAAIRTAYDIPREDNLKMRDFPTLAHTIQFVYDRRPDLAARQKKRRLLQSFLRQLPPFLKCKFL